MKIGDLVRSTISLNGECYAGIIVRTNGKCGVMILWDHGEICYSPYYELELVK